MEKAKLGQFSVFFENSMEFHRLKREIWGANSYYAELESKNPVILDIGAHIGLATLYFKRLMPSARIIAIEPVPQNIELLRKNVYENQLDNVEILEKAVASSEGAHTLYIDRTDEKWYSTAGYVEGSWSGEQSTKAITVETITLQDLLVTFKPDLVKMDIEGAEREVLRGAREQIGIASHYMIEFHPIDGIGMESIIKMFEERGYRVQVTKGGKVVPWHKARGLSMIEATK